MAKDIFKRLDKKILIRMILLLSILLFIVVLISININYKQEIEDIFEFELNDLTNIENVSMENIELIYHDIRLISYLSSLEEFLETRNDESYFEIVTYFESYMNTKEMYNQLRILDLEGNELIRVDYDGETSRNIDGNQLQNKYHRYYFQEALTLEGDEIYISPFDLNVENSIIELPYKPMIRFAKPLYNEYNEKKGIVILNYFGSNFLYHFQDNHENNQAYHAEVMLLNKESFWLKSDNEDQEWGFMFEEKAKLNFENNYSEEWALILKNTSGQFQTDNGLFTFKKLSYDEIDVSVAEYNANTWYLVIYVSNEELSNLKSNIIATHLKYAIMIYPFILLISLLSVTLLSLNRKYQLALIEAKNQAESSSELKSRFLANMSHEIRTPMHAIIGMSFLALQNNLEKDIENYLLNIHNAANGLIRIVNDILDFTKIEMDKMVLEEIPFKITLLIDALSSMFNRNIIKKNIHFNFVVPEDVPKIILGDPGRLNQVFLNLLSNAIKFTEDGFIDLKCEVIAYEDNLVCLHFAISDTGIGIKEDAFEKLFEDYEQVGDDTSRKYGGTGLGLSISRKIVRLMGGDLSVESEFGLGTTFKFDLKFPYIKENSDMLHDYVNPTVTDVGYFEYMSAKPILSVQPIEITDIRMDKTFNVLLVDDNKYNQIIVSELMKKIKCNIEIVFNGGEALEYIKNNNIDLVIMDIQMPVLDGYETTKIIRNELKLDDLPIIGMSANIMDEDRTKALNIGMSSYVCKPIDVHRFYKEVARLMDIELNISTQSMDERLVDVNPQIINVEFGLELFNYDSEKYYNTLKNSVEAYQNTDVSLVELINQSHYQDASKIIHNIGGVFGNLGMLRLHELARKLETALKKFDVKEALNLIKSYKYEYELILNELDEIISKPKEKSIVSSKVDVDFQTWLRSLNDALGERNAVEIKLSSEAYLAYADENPWLEPVIKMIDRYEFDLATTEVSKYIESR